jgi:predicted PurR-regulated permease PerM
MASPRNDPAPLPWGPRIPDGGPSNRAIVRVVVLLVVLFGMLWAAWLSRQIITWIFVAALLAVAINPLVNQIQRRLRLPRVLAISAVYILGMLVTTGVAAIFVPELITAGDQLVEDVPRYADRLQESRLVQDLDERYGLLNEIETRLTDVVSSVAGPSTAVDITTRVANGLVAAITIAVVTFLLSLHGTQIREWAVSQFSPDMRPRVQRVADDMYRVIAGYAVGLLIVATVAGTAAWAFLTLLGVPGAPVLALWVGLMTLVPLVGATLGGVPYVVVSFFVSIPVGVAALAFLLVYQQVENNFVQPVIQKRTVQLNPLWIIIAVLIGAKLLGLVGVLFAIPVAGMLQVTIQEFWTRRPRPVLTPETSPY